MTSIPTHLKFTAEHEWIDGMDAGTEPVTIGITATAADALGDIVFLELPAVGSEVTAGSVVGEIESTKSVSELYAPVSGTVTEVNTVAVDDPSIVNSAPYDAGWLIKVTVTEAGPLLSAEEYERIAAV